VTEPQWLRFQRRDDRRDGDIATFDNAWEPDGSNVVDTAAIEASLSRETTAPH
jgi:hypothetical protein